MYGLDQQLKPKARTCAFVDQGSVALPAPLEADEHEALLRTRVSEYLTFLNSDQRLNDEFRLLKARVITAACCYVNAPPRAVAAPHQEKPDV